MNYYIKEISAKETHTVRHPVLREGKPIESCVFDGDELDTTFHLGLFLDKKLVGISSFFKCKTNLLTEDFQYQLRGMAVLKEYQSMGFGKLVLNHGEMLLKNQNIKIVWCNAREKAVNFYKQNNYKTIGTPFNIKDIGLHYVMFKTI